MNLLAPRISRRAFLRRAGAAAGISPLAWACRGPDGHDATRGGSHDAAPSPPPAAGPNLLFIMADDLGYADLSGYGRRDYVTPALDALAREGVRLTQAYAAAPVCSPTRVALMTGRYPARVEAGLHEPLTTHPIGLQPEPPTLPRRLRDAGYATALVGKWHLGLAPEYHPLRHGFDEFYGHLGAAVDYATGLGTEHLRHDFFDGERPVEVTGYLTDLLTARAIEYVERPRDRPFFLSLQYNAPHWPWQAPGDPPYPDSLRWSRGGSAATYAAMVRSMDDGVGRLLEALRATGLERDTLVIFTSDNGGERWSDMDGLREGKMTLWEGGIRVGAFARWPGVIPTGTTIDQVAITMDWTATLLATAGVAADPGLLLDGVDLRPQLAGEPSVTRELFWRVTQRRRFKAMRSGDWKYLIGEDGREHLFDLASDPGESRDLASIEAAVLERLRSSYAAWEAAVLEPVALEDRFR